VRQEHLWIATAVDWLPSTSQLQALGATISNIPSAPPGVGLSWLPSFDLTLAWLSAFNLSISPILTPGNKLGGILNGGAGQANGTMAANRFANRTGRGSGVFTLGAPRQVEFGVKIRF
jgi:hypothetical protein